VNTPQSTKNIDLKMLEEYLTRLVNVNETKKVFVTKDIFNEDSSLIANKGIEVNEAFRNHIIKSSFSSDIEKHLSIDNELDGIELFKRIQDYLSDHPSYLHIHTLLNLDSHLRFLCNSYQQFPILRQKITVLALQLPIHFNRSLGAAWFSLLISCQRQLSEEEIQSAFLAGLCMEIGLLHLPPFNDSEAPKWTQSHAIIGWKILKGISELHNDVSLAVLEHHERCDGSGFPKASIENELGLIGQIVGMSCFIIDQQHIQGNGNTNIKSVDTKSANLHNIIPALQVNATVHRYDIYETVITLIRKTSQENVSFLSNDNIESMINGILDKTKQLIPWVDTLDLMLATYTGSHQNKTFRSIKQSYTRLLSTIHGAGLLDSTASQWLNDVKNKKLTCDFKEVENFDQFINELQRHLIFITSQCKHLLADKKNATDNDTLSYKKSWGQGLKKIETFR